MHGRPRNFKDKLKDPKAAESYKKKVDAIRTGTTLVLECRKAKRYDPAVLEASSKLLKVVPEIYTLWNHRREALDEILKAGGQAAAAACAVELALTQACLMENPKSYSSWHHRKWVVISGDCDLEKEMALITRALEQDSRNFHAWSYRQFVVQRMGRPLGQELEYSETLIGQDFSNYSAWHYRTILLPKLHCSPVPVPGSNSDHTSSAGSQTHERTAAEPHTSRSGENSTEQQQQTSSSQVPEHRQGTADVQQQQQQRFAGSATQQQPIPLQVLDEEYDMVHQAFATDSQDQSPWMYYRWLVGNSLSHLEAARNLDISEASQVAAVVAAAAAAATHINSSSSNFIPNPHTTSSQDVPQPPPADTQNLSLSQLSVTETTNTMCSPPISSPACKPASSGRAEVGTHEAGVRAILQAVFAREVGRFEEDHLSVEPDSKWPLLTVARLKEAQARHELCDETTAVVMAQVKALYLRLCELDPLRRGFYMDAADGKAYVVVSATGSSA